MHLGELPPEIVRRRFARTGRMLAAVGFHRDDFHAALLARVANLKAALAETMLAGDFRASRAVEAEIAATLRAIEVYEAAKHNAKSAADSIVAATIRVLPEIVAAGGEVRTSALIAEAIANRDASILLIY